MEEDKLHWSLLPFVGRVKNSRSHSSSSSSCGCFFLPSLSLSHFLYQIQNPNPFTSQSNHGRWFLLDCSSLFRFQTLSSRSSISIRSVFSPFRVFPQFRKLKIDFGLCLEAVFSWWLLFFELLYVLWLLLRTEMKLYEFGSNDNWDLL